MKQTIEITAADTLCFKDGKPFNLGDETFADSYFPPLPSVVAGFLRNLALHQSAGIFNGNRTMLLNAAGITIKSFHLATAQQLLFPLPFDVQKQNAIAAYAVLQNNIITKQSEVSHYFMQEMLKGKTDEGKFYFTADGFAEYCKGENANTFSQTILNLKEYITEEFKVGMGRNDATRTAEEGQLYTVKMIRPQHGKNELHMVVEIESRNTSLNNLTGRLGAEGKIAVVNTSSLHAHILKPTIDKDGDCIKMIVTTPAVFENGWLPDIPAIKNKIIAAATGKPIPVGGWDMISKKPKHMLKGVSAGAVYVLNGSKNELEDLIDTYHGKSICTTAINNFDYSTEGFGIVYFAKTHTSQKIKS
jgi:CRISPR-associated protein Cmr3